MVIPPRILFFLAPVGLLGGGIIGSQIAMSLSNLEILRNGYYTKGALYIAENITVGFMAGCIVGLSIVFFLHSMGAKLKYIILGLILFIFLSNFPRIYLEEKIRPPLVRASYLGHLDQVKNALNTGENLDIQDINGQTPLMISSRRGFSEIVEVLIHAEAKVNVVDREGTTALMEAITGEGFTGHPHIAKQLIEAGADVNHKRNNGATALMLAAEINDQETLVNLVRAGASIKATDKTGLTAFDYAKRKGNFKILKLLNQYSSSRS